MTTNTALLALSLSFLLFVALPASAAVCGDSILDVGEECDDGLACNGIERCSTTGGCLGGTPVDCSSLNAECTVGFCSETANGNTSCIPKLLELPQCDRKGEAEGRSLEPAPVDIAIDWMNFLWTAHEDPASGSSMDDLRTILKSVLLDGDFIEISELRPAATAHFGVVAKATHFSQSMTNSGID